jgi:hypothetical protein
VVHHGVATPCRPSRNRRIFARKKPLPSRSGFVVI